MPHESASTLEHGVYGNLSLCSQAIFTHVWLQNKLYLIPFKVRTVVLHQQKHWLPHTLSPNWNNHKSLQSLWFLPASPQKNVNKKITMCLLPVITNCLFINAFSVLHEWLVSGRHEISACLEIKFPSPKVHPVLYTINSVTCCSTLSIHGSTRLDSVHDRQKKCSRSSSLSNAFPLPESANCLFII